jgi:hypothetical protein
MTKLKIIIKSLEEKYLDPFIKILISSFHDKFTAIYKRQSFDEACLILKNLVLLQKNQTGIIEGCYIA